jgi:hypothetical protein
MGDRFQMASVQVEVSTTKKNMANRNYSKESIDRKQKVLLKSAKLLNFQFFQSQSAIYFEY